MRKQEQYRKGLTKHIGVGVFAIIAIVMISIPGYALWVGQSQINPYVEVQGVYESNVFRTNADEESDFVTVISPGIHLEFPTEKDSPYRLSANYRTNIKFYRNNGDADLDPDEELNTMEHRLDGQFKVDFASGLKLGTGYVLNITSNPPDRPGDVRNKYKEHQVMAQAGYAFVDRYEAQFSYGGTFKRYDESSNQVDDLTVHNLEAAFFYRIFPSTSVLGGGGYVMVNRSESLSDSNEYRGFGGIRFEATERTTGTVKVGFMRKDFKESDLDAANSAFVSGDVAMNFSETTRLNLHAERAFHDSSVSEETFSHGAYYIVTGIQATMAHTLATLPKLALSGEFGYWSESYPEDPRVEDRSDSIMEVGVGAEYKFYKFIVLGANFSYSKSDSNFDEYDYTNTSAMVKIRAIM